MTDRLLPDWEKYNFKPCPFCGCEKVVIERDFPPSENPALDREWVECTYCRAMGPAWRVTRTHRLAIKYWNKRAKQ